MRLACPRILRNGRPKILSAVVLSVFPSAKGAPMFRLPHVCILCCLSALLGGLFAICLVQSHEAHVCQDDVVWQNFDTICDRLDALERAR